MKFRTVLIALLCTLTVACSKTIEGTYVASNAKLGSIRFDANGKATPIDASGNKLATRPYSIKKKIITLEGPGPAQEFREIDSRQLETKDAEGKIVVYRRR
jgi:hypothetical protein